MVARSSSDASTYSSAETRRETKIPKRGGGGGLGAYVLGSSSQNVVKIRREALVDTLAFVVVFFPVSFFGCWWLLNTSDTVLVKQCNEMLDVEKRN